MVCFVTIDTPQDRKQHSKNLKQIERLMNETPLVKGLRAADSEEAATEILKQSTRPKP